MSRITLILIAIAALGGLLVFVLGAIIVLKARREIHERRCRRRRAALEPLVLRYCQAESGTLLQFLGDTPGNLDREVLERILSDLIRAVRGSARERLIRASEELGIVDQAIAQLKNRRPWLRAEAAEKLGVMRSSSAQWPLADAMEDESSEVRIRAAKALGLVGGRVAVAKLVTALREPNRWSALRVADILAGMGADSVDELIAVLGEIPTPSRLLVLDIFGRVRNLKAIPLLRSLLEHEDGDIRARSVHALGQIGDPGSIPHLVKSLQDDDWPVRAMAAKALGRIPGTKQVNPLCAVLIDSQWWVRVNAAEALKGKGEPGHRALVGMLESDDPYAREQAAFMLQESGVLDDYINKLVSDDPVERDRANAVVVRLVKMRRVDRLKDLAAVHPDPQLRRRVDELLELPASQGSA